MHVHYYAVHCFQYDHCKDDLMMWSDTQKFKSAADDKPGLPPDSVVEIFMEVTHVVLLF